MSYYGDIRLGDTIDVKFTTVSTTGAPTTLAGSPVISAYPGNSTTELTAGITLSVDFDSRTGMHNVRVVATSGNGYATATNYELVITTGTVGGTSVVGYVIGSFSIENRSAVMPTVAARTLDVTANGNAGIDWANIDNVTAVAGMTNTTIATVTTVTNQLTAAAIATGVWQDATAGDFTVASSVGKALYIANVVPGAAGGHFIAGTNAATTITTGLTTTFTGNLTGSVASVTGSVGSVTGLTTTTITNAVWDENRNLHSTTSSFGSALQIHADGIAQAGTASTITLNAGESAIDGFHNGSIIETVDFTGSRQMRLITGYVGATKVCTISPNWLTNPDATTHYLIRASGMVSVRAWIDSAVAATNIAIKNTLAKTTDITGFNDIAASAIISDATPFAGANIAAIKAKTDFIVQGIQKNVAFANFHVFMVSSTDHVTGKTGAAVSGFKLRAGTDITFQLLDNLITELASGLYQVNLTANDLNANVITLGFIGSGCDTRTITIITKP